MNGITKTLWLVLLAAMLCVSAAQAQVVTREDAADVASRWVTFNIAHRGGWGGSQQATVESILEWTHGQYMLGYFCVIKPHGFILVPPRRELGVVKAYSEVSDLDPYEEDGMADLLRIKMEGILKAIEDTLGPVPTVSTQALESMLEFSYRQNWDAFDRPIDQDYHEGDYLLQTTWHQFSPYNRYCPPGNNNCDSTHCAVGCVATAGAQIMRHWCWPPNQGYNWTLMPSGNNWNWTDPQADAVATLCHNVGEQAHMHYCEDSNSPCASGTNTYEMLGVFSNNSYTSGSRVNRDDFDAVAWYNIIVDQLNLNQPVQYRVQGHSIVCDGWMIDGLGRQYHMNYGRAMSYTGWYVLDDLPPHHIPEEYMLRDVRPAPSFGPNLAGEYHLGFPFPYRYFCQDAISVSPTRIVAGNRVQFLPKIVVTAGPDAPIRIEGRDEVRDTWLFSRGDMSKGIRLTYGNLVLSNGGQIKFH